MVASPVGGDAANSRNVISRALRRKYSRGLGSAQREVLQLCRSALISWADMVLEPSVAGLFKWPQFEPEMILLAVAWYFRFSLSYRQVEELLSAHRPFVD